MIHKLCECIMYLIKILAIGLVNKEFQKLPEIKDVILKSHPPRIREKTN